VPLPVHHSLWWNIKDGSKLKVCIIGNFCSQIFFFGGGFLSEGGTLLGDAVWGFGWTCHNSVSCAPFVMNRSVFEVFACTFSH
jgi:hypothetical protein